MRSVLRPFLIFSLTACAADPSAADSPSSSVEAASVAVALWHPTPGTSWQWQLDGTIDTSVDASVYDIDLFTTPQATIDALHAAHRKVVCYFSAGSHEPGRPDSADFPAAVIGKVLDGWPDERWLDIRATAVKDIMKKRLDVAVTKHCDGVEPDNVDGYENATGFPLTGANQIAYDQLLATEGHSRGLAVALKNDVDQIASLVGSFDFALNEECAKPENDECDKLTPFITAGKAVFHVEYGSASLARTVCPDSNRRNFDTLIKDLDLDAWRVSCR